MDPETISQDAIVKVTNWLLGVWEMRRSTGQVQQWVDSIPPSSKTNTVASSKQPKNSTEDQSKPTSSTTSFVKYSNIPEMTVSAPVNIPVSSSIAMPGISRLVRDPSLQSDSSRCSSVESLLELRKADPEAILMGLGFGGCTSNQQESGPLSRIPKRFLQPSKLKGIAINDFVKHQQETSESFDSVSLGYRGLTGSPYVAPSEIVQKIMDRLRDHETHELDTSPSRNNVNQNNQQTNTRLSVLSPDNRQFLEQPRSRSPDMRHKRMIIGKKSFAFGCNGDLIEINPSKSETLIESQVGNNFNDFSETEDDTAPSDGTQDTGTATLELNDNENILDKEDDQFLKFNFDSRRVSDSAYETSFFKNKLWTNTNRRFSDGTVNNEVNINKDENCTNYRRKSLRRQSRITDTDAMEEYYVPNTLHNASTSKHFVNPQSLANDEELKDKINPEQEASVDKVCCFNEKRGKICHHDENFNECCVHSNSNACCNKIKMVIAENKRLESMVKKSRREMAEIRDMLSNVLSVRMEPGF